MLKNFYETNLAMDFRFLVLSLTDDTLTIYSKENFIVDTKGNVETTEYLRDLFKNCYNYLTHQINESMQAERFVIATDDDHSLYHQDYIGFYFGETRHRHLKFKTPITEENLIAMLNVMVESKLLSNKERNSFFDNYKKRFTRLHDLADMILRDSIRENHFNPQIAKKKFLNLIQFTECNDLLIGLQQYLLNPEFDYLRVPEDNQVTKWQGTNREGKVVLCSELWAMIEKAISLQMAVNVSRRCNNLKKEGAKQAQRMSQHSFFKITRKEKEGSHPNNVYINLQRGDGENLESSHQKLFRR